MKIEIQDISEIAELVSKLVDIFVETTVAISKKLAEVKQDNVIKAFADVLKAQAAAVESNLTVLRRELAKIQSDVNESKVVRDTKAQLSSDVSAVQTEMQAVLAERDKKKIPPISTNDKKVTSMETTAAEADEQAGIGVKQEQPPLLTAEAQKPAVADLRQEEVEAATFPNATDRTVFMRALSDMASQDATLRVDAAKALAGIRHELSVRALAGQMGREQSAKVRQECIRSLTTLNMKKGLATVESALTDQVAQVRLVAVWGLYRLVGSESIPALIRMLSDENEEVRRRAITCIGWLAREQAAVGTVGSSGSRQVVSSLIGCLDDPEKSIRTTALGVLETVTGKKMSEQLLTDEDSHQDIIARWNEWWTQELLA